MKLDGSRACDTPSLCPPAASDDEFPGRDAADREAADRELARLAKAIAHPARVRILRLLAEREACVCGELVEELPLAQSTVSQHLKVLKDAGLIRGEIAPPQVCYCLEPAGVRRLKALLGSL
ncbi:MAG TPA: metalloregulator ArsR/SmtB family transcription factor [Thermoleophilia bacterium]|nr:metalloregulator ArsR/SmtB family transcription factor [Thermoleophilia bacterium]